MGTFHWPNDDGWPYPDSETGADDSPAHLSDEIDDDMVALHSDPRLLDLLDPLERRIVVEHYGLNGATARSMKELHVELGISRAEVRGTLELALAKLRDHLVG